MSAHIDRLAARLASPRVVGTADAASVAGLVDVVSAIVWDVPGDAWGSAEKVRAWIHQFERGGES